jgi:hypothetical protein
LNGKNLNTILNKNESRFKKSESEFAKLGKYRRWEFVLQIMKENQEIKSIKRPNTAFNFDQWAFAATKLLGAPCFSGIH